MPVPNVIGRARTCRRLKYDHRIASDWLQMPPVADRRATARTPLLVEAEFRPRGQRRYCVAVENLSARGCQIARAAPLQPGCYAWIMLPTLESWYARVAWSKSGSAGLDFAQPLHPAVTDMIVRRAGEQDIRAAKG